MPARVATPPSVVLTKAISELSQELTHAFGVDAPLEHERARYVIALQKIAEFLALVGVSDFCLEKLMELALALDDLDRGRVSPLLAPEPIENRKPDSSRIWRARAHVALGIEALIMVDGNVPAAAARVEREFPEILKLTTKKANRIASAAKGWHSSFKRGKVKNTVARKIFEVGAKLIAGEDRANLVTVARHCCSTARSLALDLKA